MNALTLPIAFRALEEWQRLDALQRSLATYARTATAMTTISDQEGHAVNVLLPAASLRGAVIHALHEAELKLRDLGVSVPSAHAQAVKAAEEARTLLGVENDYITHMPKD